MGPQLTRLINECRALEVDEAGAVILALYHFSLMLRFHSKFIPIRTVHEVWVASYNLIVLLAWQANMELELVLHTPEKLLKYVAKGSRQHSLNTAISELGRRGGKNDEMASQQLEEAVEAGKREVPMTEPERIETTPLPSMVELIAHLSQPVGTLRYRLDPEACCSNCKQTMSSS